MPPNSSYATQWPTSRNHYFLFSRWGTHKSNGARVSLAKKVVRRTIPQCGIVLILGTAGCGGWTVYSPQQTTYISGASLFRSRSNQQEEELVKLIQDFLKDVPNNERTTFDRFFADDVIYTRGTGQLVTKQDILTDTGKTTVPR